ncbi:MAG: hypothetical protein GWP15_00750 [Nitrospirae bacterium]|nr:hypothetical protein [Nitrospirota bacterium]
MSEQSTALEQLAPNLEVMKNLAVTLLDELNGYRSEIELAGNLIPTVGGPSLLGAPRGDICSHKQKEGFFQKYWKARGVETPPGLPSEIPTLKQIEDATSGHIAERYKERVLETYIYTLWEALRFVRLVRDGGNDVRQSGMSESINVEGTDTERVQTIGDDVRIAVAKIIPIIWRGRRGRGKCYVATGTGEWTMGMSYTSGYEDLQKPAIEARLAIFAQQLEGVDFDKERLTLTVDRQESTADDR